MTEKLAQQALPKARYRLYSPTGQAMGTYDTALEAASAASAFWPGVERDDGRRAGWDVEAI